MFLYDCLIAMILLLQPPEQTPSLLPNQPELFAVLGETVQYIAVKWEILDEREARYVLVEEKSFHTDLNLLRTRYVELADAPCCNDCMRFPPRIIINEYVSFNRAYRQHIEIIQSLSPGKQAEYREICRQVDLLYSVWESVRDAQGEYYYITVRRQALLRLKKLLGDEDYYNGRLPPHVPTWSFEEIK